jgi:hypothetical protein
MTENKFRPTSKGHGAEHLAKEAALRAKAAKQAAVVKAEAAPVELVSARVLPLGDGKISMGVHVGGIGEVHFDKGEIIPPFPRERAEELQVQGWVEIIEPA